MVSVFSGHAFLQFVKKEKNCILSLEEQAIYYHLFILNCATNVFFFSDTQRELGIKINLNGHFNDDREFHPNAQKIEEEKHW